MQTSKVGRVFCLDELEDADLILGATYEGGTADIFAGDPRPKKAASYTSSISRCTSASGNR